MYAITIITEKLIAS